MIKKIGFKRAALIFVLLGALAIILFFNYGVFQPQLASTQAELGTISGEMTKLSDEVATMKINLEKFEAKRTLFDTITHRGFFDNQERVAARGRFDAIQKLSNVISARYEIRAANVIDDETVKDTDYVIVETPVIINLTALTDVDIYKFIYYLNYAHPGNVAISSIKVKRNTDVNQETLRSIGTGKPVDIVSANIEFTWTTMANRAAMMAPTKKAAEGDAAQAAPGQNAPDQTQAPTAAPAQGPQT